jgi:hypothetical protein
LLNVKLYFGLFEIILGIPQRRPGAPGLRFAQLVAKGKRENKEIV